MVVFHEKIDEMHNYLVLDFELQENIDEIHNASIYRAFRQRMDVHFVDSMLRDMKTKLYF